MTRQSMFSTLVLLGLATSVSAQPRKPWITGLKNPESVAIGTDGRTYVTVIGEFDKDGDGSVQVIQDGKAVPFATGLDDPKGMVSYLQWLFVADKKRIWRIDAKGKAEVFVAADAFPRPPLSSTTSPSMSRAERSLRAIPAISRGKVELSTESIPRER